MIVKNRYNNLVQNRKIFQKTNGFLNDKHYKYLESSLDKEEFINMSFIGIHNCLDNNNHASVFAYAITDQHFILAQNSLFSKKIEKIKIEDINLLQFSSINNFGIISIKTVDSSFSITIEYNKAKHVYKLMEIYI